MGGILFFTLSKSKLFFKFFPFTACIVKAI
nr:MAG TPA: hypothetical protein [Caudoviricetes sp.]